MAMAQEQEEATLRVLITSEEDGNPIIGGNVLLLRGSGSQDEDKRVRTGVTDNDGFYAFRGVPPGKYRLQISHVRHQTHQQVLTLEEGELRVERIRLTVRTQTLEEVVVEGERNVTTGQVGVRQISPTDIGRIPTPGPGSDLASYLQTLPGVEMPGGRGGNLYIRGGTPMQNRILIDNVPLIKPFHISNLFSAVPGSMVQSVDLFAGGFGAEYMGRSSAVVDIQLRPGDMKNFEASSALSPYLFSFRAEGPIETNRQSFVVSGRHSFIRESAPYVTGQDVPLDFYDLMGRYSMRSEGLTCNVTAIRTRDSGQINPDRGIALSWSNTAIGARCAGLGQRYAQPFDVTVGYSNYHNDEIDRSTSQTGDGSGSETERESGLSLLFFNIDLEHQIWGLPLNYGFDATLPIFSATLDKRFTALQTFNIPTESVRAFGSLEWRPNDYLTVEPSVGSQLTLRTSPTLEPRLRVSYRPDGTTDQELSLALGKYSQLMSGISDELDAGTVFNVLTPNEGETPIQTALHGILGYEQHFGDYFEANVEGYVKKHNDIPVSQWSPEPRVEVETARANGLSYGLDTRIEYDRSPVYVYLGYGWSKVEYEAAVDDLGAWIEGSVFSYAPSHDRRHKLNLVGTYEFGEFTANVRWEFGTGRPYTQVYGYDLTLRVPEDNPLEDPGQAKIFYSQPYGARLPSYHRLDLSVTRTFQLSSQMSIDAKVGAINLYDRKNIFYLNATTLQRVNQTPLFPYISLTATLN